MRELSSPHHPRRPRDSKIAITVCTSLPTSPHETEPHQLMTSQCVSGRTLGSSCLRQESKTHLRRRLLGLYSEQIVDTYGTTTLASSELCLTLSRRLAIPQSLPSHSTLCKALPPHAFMYTDRRAQLKLHIATQKKTNRASRQHVTQTSHPCT